MPKIIETIDQVRELVRGAKAKGLTVGLVPTMGYLHEGHMTLVKRSRLQCDLTIVSIFVNPTQFGEGEDFDRYPRDMESDSELCQREGADAIFVPSASEIYGEGFQTVVRVEELSLPLCGAHRPGHFDGVATVVLKLLNIVQPDAAFFGEKDFQQLQVIRRMVRDLDVAVEIVPVPIVREPDGLAMSSRNSYLTGEERSRALALSRSLVAVQERVNRGVSDGGELVELVRGIISQAGIEVEYVELRDPETLAEVTKIEGPTLLALAARVGKTRLIDNRVIEAA